MKKFLKCDKNYLKINLFLFLTLYLNVSSQGYTSYFTGNTTNLDVSPSFGICLMGGATENDEAMKWFLQKANGGDIVILRSTGSDGYNNYFYSQLGITVNSVETLVITSVAGATNPYVLDKVAKAEAIWFAGGDQANYVNYFKDNALEDVLNYHINIKQGVIGGTSAGMAILSSHYYSALTGASTTSVQALANPYHPSITFGKNDFLNVNILQDVITDTHFGNRNRQGRLAAFIARFKQDDNTIIKGIGADERIAVCIEPNGLAKIYGEYPARQHFAYFVFPNCEPNNNIQTCQPNMPLSWYQTYGAYKVYKVPGTMTAQYSLDLNDWTTGIGGTWLDWNVENGTFDEFTDDAPTCQPLHIDTLQIDEIIVLNPVDKDIVFNKNHEALLEIFDNQGRLIQSIPNFNHNRLNVYDLNAGVYFIRFSKDDKQLVKKIIKK